MAKSQLNKSKQRRVIWAKTNGHCWYCGTLTNPFGGFSIDHVIPRSKGGTDEVKNLVPACKKCNASKGNQSIEEWREKGPFKVKFTTEQITYLLSFGIEIPKPPRYVFEFEKRDWK